MRYALFLTLLINLIGCATRPPQTHQEWEAHLERYKREQYRQGVQAAQTDLRRGMLGFEDIQCEEDEGWQILWCYRKLLKEKYGIDYRVISPSPVPGALGRMEGYQSVVRPVIDARLGTDWESRILAEATAYHQAHWHEVAHLYKQDRESDAW